MRTSLKLGIVLLLLGGVALTLATVKFRSRNELFRVGEFRATTTSQRNLPALRYAGAGFVVAGALLIVVSFGGSRRR